MTKQIRCPRSLADIEPMWLTEVLQPRYPGVEATNVEVVELTQGTSTRMRIRAQYAQNGADTPPEALFVKSSFDNDFHDMMTSAGIYEAEVKVYTEILPGIAARTPALHASAVDEADGQFLLVIEDLIDSGIVWPRAGGPIDVDTAAEVLAAMASWHGRFWEDRSLDSHLWMPTPKESADRETTKLFVQVGIQNLNTNWSDRLPSNSGNLETAFEKLMEYDSLAPRTVLHGDPHLGNMGFLDGRLVFFDWQVVRKGQAALDLSYFMTMSLDIADRRDHEEELLREYLERRTAFGGGTESFDSLWKAYRAQVLYGLLVWAPVPEFMQPKEVTTPYLTRALAALNDLDTLTVIRSL